MSQSLVRLRTGVVTQMIDGGMLLLDTERGTYYDLNRSGSLMLQQLLDGASVAQTIASVQAEFQIQDRRIAADLDSLLQQLQHAGLVELIAANDDQRPAP